MNEYEEEGFGLSIGDVMSALLLIIILVMLAIVMQLKEETDLSSQFEKRQRELSEALKVEFGADTTDLWMHIRNDGEIEFIPPQTVVLFDERDVKPLPKFQGILREFFPRYLRALNGYEHYDEIREIRVEGHTDTIAKKDPYLTNIRWSQDRSYEVLKFVLRDAQIVQTLDSMNMESQVDWFQKRTVPMGFGLNKLIYKDAAKSIVDMDRSRRVCFRPLIDFEPYMKLAPKE